MFKNVSAEAEISWLLDPAVRWATEELDLFVKALLPGKRPFSWKGQSLKFKQRLFSAT